MSKIPVNEDKKVEIPPHKHGRSIRAGGSRVISKALAAAETDRRAKIAESKADAAGRDRKAWKAKADREAEAANKKPVKSISK